MKEGSCSTEEMEGRDGGRDAVMERSREVEEGGKEEEREGVTKAA